MFFILFAVTVSNIIDPIEGRILQEYRGTVMVKFTSKTGILEVAKRNNEILISSFPSTMDGDMIEPSSSEIGEGEESRVLMKNRRGGMPERTPVAYYNGKNFKGLMKEYFISYIIFGCKCGYLYSLEQIEEDRGVLIGTNRNGLYVEFDKSSGLPMVIKYGDMKITINKWIDVNGFGRLPEEADIWIKGVKENTRKIEDVSNPILESSFFASNKVKIPLILE